jgi:hydroxyacylglutathione hydrolase
MILETFTVGPLQCNCVILGDERSGSAIVVDPGDEVERIVAALQRRGLRAVAIVATHAHIDHVGALADLKKQTGAPARLHEADVPLYEELALQAQWLGIEPPSMTTIDAGLDESTGIAFGTSKLDVLHTPGHSPGSVSFILPSEVPMLLSGDSLFAGSIGRTDLWGGSFDELMSSIRKKLMTLPDETTVLPGHGPKTTIGEERRSNPFLIAPR